MKNFLQSLINNFKFPNSHGGRKTLLLEKEVQIKNKIKLEVDKLQFKPSITLDVWCDSNLHYSYLGITLHFIDVKLNEIKQIFLDLKNLETQHTGEFIKKETKEILKSYNLDLEKLYKIVTDNAKNMTKAFKIYKEISSSDEEIVKVLDDIDIDLINSFQSLKIFSQRIGCFAHTINLILRDFYDEALKNTIFFNNVVKIINHIQQSSLLTQELFRKTNKRLISPSSTRWGSYIYALKQFLDLEQEIKEIAEYKKWDYLTQSDLAYLKLIYKLLEPFLEVLNDIQAEKIITISKNYMYIKTFLAMFEDKENLPSLYNEKMFLKEKLNERFNYYFDVNCNKFEPIFIIATALDPNTINVLQEEELNLAKNLIENLLPKISEDVLNQTLFLPSTTKNSTLNNYLSKIYGTQLQSKEKNKPNTLKKSIINNCLNYLLNLNFSINNLTNTIAFWNNVTIEEYLPIKKLAFEIFSVPSTSSPIERVFSQAGFATRLHRNKTKLSFLNSQLMVYLNREI